MPWRRAKRPRKWSAWESGADSARCSCSKTAPALRGLAQAIAREAACGAVPTKLPGTDLTIGTSDVC